MKQTKLKLLVKDDEPHPHDKGDAAREKGYAEPEHEEDGVVLLGSQRG